MIYLFDDKNSKAKQTIRASEKKAKANANKTRVMPEEKL